jgi:hypothetical protein
VLVDRWRAAPRASCAILAHERFDDRVPTDICNRLRALRPHLRHSPGAIDRLRQPLANRPGVRRDDETSVPVAHKLQWLTRIGARQHRFAALEGLDRDVTEVFLFRNEADEQRVCVQVEQRRFAYAAEETDSRISGGERAQLLLVLAGASHQKRDVAPEVLVGLDHQSHALPSVQAPRHQDVVLPFWPLEAGQHGRRMQRLKADGLPPQRGIHETAAWCFSDAEMPANASWTEAEPIQRVHDAPLLMLRGCAAAILGLEHVVEHADGVHQVRDVIRVRHHERWRLRRDD